MGFEVAPFCCPGGAKASSPGFQPRETSGESFTEPRRDDGRDRHGIAAAPPGLWFRNG